MFVLQQPSSWHVHISICAGLWICIAHSICNFYCRCTRRVLCDGAVLWGLCLRFRRRILGEWGQFPCDDRVLFDFIQMYRGNLIWKHLGLQSTRVIQETKVHEILHSFSYFKSKTYTLIREHFPTFPKFHLDRNTLSIKCNNYYNSWEWYDIKICPSFFSIIR